MRPLLTVHVVFIVSLFLGVSITTPLVDFTTSNYDVTIESKQKINPSRSQLAFQAVERNYIIPRELPRNEVFMLLMKYTDTSWL